MPSSSPQDAGLLNEVCRWFAWMRRRSLVPNAVAPGCQQRGNVEQLQPSCCRRIFLGVVAVAALLLAAALVFTGHSGTQHPPSGVAWLPRAVAAGRRNVMAGAALFASASRSMPLATSRLLRLGDYLVMMLGVRVQQVPSCCCSFNDVFRMTLSGSQQSCSFRRVLRSAGALSRSSSIITLSHNNNSKQPSGCCPWQHRISSCQATLASLHVCDPVCPPHS